MGGWGQGGGKRGSGWRTVALLPVVSLFVCLLACLFSFFFFFISNRKEGTLVAVLGTHLVRGTKTAKEKEGLRQCQCQLGLEKNISTRKCGVIICLYKV